MYDLISLGDSMVDVFLEVDPNDTESVCKLDREKCLVCFDYGAKIPVSKMTRVPASGNAANNAIGSARLGLKTAIYTVLGSDQDSEETKKVFEDEDVSTEFVVMESGKRSNFSTVLNYAGERTIFAYHEPRIYKLPNFPPVNWIYYTSINKNHEILHTQIPEYIKKFDTKLAFNPGSYQLMEGMDGLKPILKVTDLLTLNREEAQILTGGNLEDIKGLIVALRQAGPKTVVVTDGQNGSYASFDGREFWHVRTPNVSVVDMTGAGDAYSTGLLTAMISNKPLAEAMIWGTLNAASVVGYVGAREGLLTKMGMEEFSRKYKEELKPKMM